MNHRDLFRNALLTLGAAAVGRSAEAREFAPDEDAFAELARAGWKPIFFDDHQNETLVALSDAIIPATDTPGAKAALVNRFLDLVMSSEPLEVQREFLGSLAYFDSRAMELYKQAFLYLTPEEKDDFLSLLAYRHGKSDSGGPENVIDYGHFNTLKGWISDAYYSSPIGLKELGWDGSAPAGFFAGCEHSPDKHDQNS
jgi:hypothetical protein